MAAQTFATGLRAFCAYLDKPWYARGVDTADNAAETWLTLADAAVRQGVSDRTIRRRIRDGELTARKQKGRVMILMADADMKPAGAPRQPDTAALVADVARLSELVRRQDAEIEYLRGALGAALQLQRPALPEPRRPWRWPWQRD